jgi:hypothetical protein
MDLTIVEASGATSEQVRVPASVAIRRIIGRLVVLWRLPDAGPDGRALSYHFEDPRTSRQIDPDTTLALAGVRDKDVLHLVASTVKPSSPTLVQAPSTAAPPVPAAIAAGAATPALADWATGHTPTPAPSPQRRVSAQLMTVLGVAALLGIGVAVASGALSGSTKKSVRLPTVAASTSVPAAPPSSPNESERSSDREGVMGLLASYQSAYTGHRVTGLEKLFAGYVRRHGLAAGGCRVSRGLRAVLASYESQFELGSGSYALTGLTARQVQIDTKTQAHLISHYKITPGGNGDVNFKFSEDGGGWKISEIDAACK